MHYKKGILAILASIIMAVSSSSAFAEAKIGVADAQRAILQSELGQKGMDQINGAFIEQEEQLKEMQKEVTVLLEKLKKDTELMSDQEFQKLLQDISVQRGQMSQLVENVQRIKLESTDRLIQSLTSRYQEAVEALVLSEKYDLILPRQSVHYRHELYDVTAKITEKMNALEK
ncbi:MAG: OmpH family outer membrane protein [Gammaproteobacteria bacterium]|nr:OmpH family outer membrane protein [Gammaproteobacteria bacterium]MBT4493230.1 OmpH family outer membrane protein [Gammaproteobacteria bacterium]MBT7369688.1 OmpH family outer membrane protein [Gammaproteobacteria bacterium]